MTIYQMIKGKTIVNVYDGRSDGSVLIRLQDRTEIIVKSGSVRKEDDVESIGDGYDLWNNA